MKKPDTWCPALFEGVGKGCLLNIWEGDWSSSHWRSRNWSGESMISDYRFKYYFGYIVAFFFSPSRLSCTHKVVRISTCLSRSSYHNKPEGCDGEEKKRTNRFHVLGEGYLSEGRQNYSIFCQ
jgi:hypothetical protein